MKVAGRIISRLSAIAWPGARAAELIHRIDAAGLAVLLVERNVARSRAIAD
jgi:hypothetical protein